MFNTAYLYWFKLKIPYQANTEKYKSYAQKLVTV